MERKLTRLVVELLWHQRGVVFVALLAALFPLLSLAQGTVRGKVSDPTGETIIGAAVKVKELPTVFATTDLDGNYSLKLPDASPYTLVISFVTLKTLEQPVQARDGQVVVTDIALAEDLPYVWSHPATSLELKKRLLRCALTCINVEIEEEPPRIKLLLHWAGGVHTQMYVKRNRTGELHRLGLLSSVRMRIAAINF